LTRALDEFSRMRRKQPWPRVEKESLFDDPGGKQTLSKLFGRNSQLVVNHFLFGPNWEEGRVGCSYLVDHIDGLNFHLVDHDVAVVVVSRASFDKLEAFKARIGGVSSRCPLAGAISITTTMPPRRWTNWMAAMSFTTIRCRN